MERAGDVLKQLLQGKHTVLNPECVSVLVVVESRGGGYGKGFVETLRHSNRWCSESISDEPRLPGAKSQVDSRFEVSRSEV